MPYNPNQPRDPSGSSTGGQWSGGGSSKPSPFWKATYPGDWQRSGYPELDRLEEIGRNESLSREERAQAFKDRAAVSAAMSQTYRGDNRTTVKMTIDNLVAGGADKLEVKGPRAYLRSADGSQRWEIHSKVERDYAEYRLSKRYQEVP